MLSSSRFRWNSCYQTSINQMLSFYNNKLKLVTYLYYKHLSNNRWAVDQLCMCLLNVLWTCFPFQILLLCNKTTLFQHIVILSNYLYTLQDSHRKKSNSKKEFGITSYIFLVNFAGLYFKEIVNSASLRMAWDSDMHKISGF